MARYLEKIAPNVADAWRADELYLYIFNRLGRYVTTGSNKECDHITPRHNLDSISGDFLDILTPVTPLKIFTILVGESNGSA